MRELHCENGVCYLDKMPTEVENQIGSGGVGYLESNSEYFIPLHKRKPSKTVTNKRRKATVKIGSGKRVKRLPSKSKIKRKVSKAKNIRKQRNKNTAQKKKVAQMKKVKAKKSKRKSKQLLQ
jgi:hypothetical protein